MEENEWSFMDRRGWARGAGPAPWDKEPIDKKVWKDLTTGFDCMVHRGRSGAWCGYVGVPKSHRFFGDNYDDHYDIDVHGGLTFSSECQEIDDDGSGVCHPADEGDHVWWFGFDCAHLHDFTPAYESVYGPLSEEYRTLQYVVDEVESLAKQLV